jgi:hypothetical protein
MAMTTRQSTKTITMPSATMASATEESVPERVTQRKPEGGRFRLQVDRQTKGSYATYEAAEKVGLVTRASDPSSRGLRRRREREQNYRIAVSHDCFTRHPRVVTRHMSGANQLGSENRKAISRASTPPIWSVGRHRCRADLRWPTETRLHGWGERTRSRESTNEPCI